MSLLAVFLFLSSFFMNPNVSAHALSASFTQIEFNPSETKMTFSLDVLSVIESMGGDTDNNGVLNEKELEALHRRLEEWIDDCVIVEMNQKQQEGNLESLTLGKKGDKDVVTWTFHFPAFTHGQTISLNDGLYTQSTGGTNYVNLITSKHGSEVSQAVLQGKNRTWTILLTEQQVQQQADPTGNGGQSTPTSPSSTAPKAPGASLEESPSPSQPASQSTDTNSGRFSFFFLGMHHILTGYDHLLFLFALLLRKQTFKQYAAIISAFTVAHSITLTLAVLGWVSLPSRLVESVIALSICYVAVENIFRKDVRYRWILTFIFGLIHGLGFATVLQEMELPKSNLAFSLISFNVGIEVVQLLLVLLLFPLLKMLHQVHFSRQSVTYGSIAISLLGGFWLIERLFM
ncbi:HupE/UreJ family protein [Paenibacillus sp. LMG 31456]|uniref:HupE/UreJ family protein n=2 Tax=Paenibacillus foliorum TaxID=2654974 RepID=A0A972GKK0_9BACL|nr:HupE/UreJ family protein [Paenibacillus foliorum]